jgi:hypothetical protein
MGFPRIRAKAPAGDATVRDPRHGGSSHFDVITQL